MAETKEVSYLGFNRTKTQIQNSSGLQREECLCMKNSIDWVAVLIVVTGVLILVPYLIGVK